MSTNPPASDHHIVRPELDWKPTGHELAIMLILSLTSFVVSLDATVIVTSIGVSGLYARTCAANSKQDRNKSLRWNSHGRILDRHELPAHLCSVHAVHLQSQRYLRTWTDADMLAAPLHPWYNSV